MITFKKKIFENRDKQINVWSDYKSFKMFLDEWSEQKSIWQLLLHILRLLRVSCHLIDHSLGGEDHQGVQDVWQEGGLVTGNLGWSWSLEW